MQRVEDDKREGAVHTGERTMCSNARGTGVETEEEAEPKIQTPIYQSNNHCSAAEACRTRFAGAGAVMFVSTAG